MVQTVEELLSSFKVKVCFGNFNLTQSCDVSTIEAYNGLGNRAVGPQPFIWISFNLRLAMLLYLQCHRATGVVCQDDKGVGGESQPQRKQGFLYRTTRGLVLFLGGTD